MKLTLEELNSRLATWLEEEAQQRIHGTTGEKPYDRWLVEKSSLTFPTNVTPYQVPAVRDHYTTQYGIMSHRGVTYHLGQAYARTKIMVREIQEHGLPSLEIYHENQLIKTILIPTKRHTWVTVFDELNDLDKRDQEKDSQKPASPPKRDKSYGISVGQRESSYYQITTPATKGVTHG